MKKLRLTNEQFSIVDEYGQIAVVQVPINIPESIDQQILLLAKHPLKAGTLLDGVTEDGRTVPLVVGSVRLNLKDCCLDVPIASQFEVLL